MAGKGLIGFGVGTATTSPLPIDGPGGSCPASLFGPNGSKSVKKYKQTNAISSTATDATGIMILNIPEPFFYDGYGGGGCPP